MNLKKILILTVIITMLGIGTVVAQGPPEDVGPPEHVVERQEENDKGQGPPEHAKEERVGPPAHANVPDEVREMITQRIEERLIGPPAFANVPDFVRAMFEERVADEVYSVEFAEENELEGVEISIYDEKEDEVEEVEEVETVTTEVYGRAETELEIGDYNFTASKVGYLDYEGDFEVEDENNEVSFEMEEGDLQVSELSVEPETGEEGDEIEVTAVIENMSDEEVEQDVELNVEWGDSYTSIEKSVTIEGGESEEVTFDELEVAEDADTGETEIKVETEDHSKSVYITVEE